MNWLTF